MNEIKLLENLEQFQMFLNQPPTIVKKNELANNSLYVPISELEKTLDELYSGLWQTEKFNFQVIANEIVGSLELKVFHPVAKIWITRVGCASVPIQMDSWLKDENGEYVLKNNKKVKDPNFKITDVDRKITNTLVKDFGHLKAECLKNACKSLGVVFGRNLNRKTQISQTETLSKKILKNSNINDWESPLFQKALESVKKGFFTVEQIAKKYDLNTSTIQVLKNSEPKKLNENEREN